MLKTLCTSFCRTKLQKNPWVYPMNSYSELSTQETMKDVNEKGNLCKKEDELLVAENETNKIGLKNTNEFFKPTEKLLATNNTEVDTTKSPTKTVTKKKKSEQCKVKVTPKIKNLEMVKTTLAVHVGPSILSWAFVDHNFNVLDWNWHVWYCEKAKSRSFDLINLVLRIVLTLPQAGAYVMEEIQIPHKGNRSIQKLLIQQQLATSIMSCVLFKDRESSQLPPLKLMNNIYVLHTHSTAHWYNLFVGSEIISTDYVMKTLFSNNVPQTDKLYASVNTELLNKYMKAEVDEREQINWSLLKALLFLRLLKNAETKK